MATAGSATAPVCTATLPRRSAAVEPDVLHTLAFVPTATFDGGGEQWPGLRHGCLEASCGSGRASGEVEGRGEQKLGVLNWSFAGDDEAMLALFERDVRRYEQRSGETLSANNHVGVVL